MLDLSILIVNFNNAYCLKNCLDSIYSHAPEANFEVIVVDNNSADNSVQVVRQNWPVVNVIVNPENRGYVAANNQGIQASRGRYVLSLNNDTVIDEGTLDGLISFMDNHPDVGVCGPKVLNQDGTLQRQCRRSFPTISSSLSYFFRLHRFFPKNKYFGRYLMTHLDDETTAEVDSVSGCCMMVRREVVDRIGALDENFIMYGDDLDWCYRIKRSGWKVCYVSDVRIVHLGGQSSRRLPSQCVLLFFRAMAIFYRKHHAQRHTCITNCVVYVGICLKALLALCANILRKEKVVGTKKPASDSSA